jgi:DNA polymerase III epsilon subunit-like protein
LGGATESSTHSHSLEEIYGFADWINSCLGKDPDLKKHLPIDPNTNALFTAVNDGLVICKLINDAVAGTIDERVLNKPKAGADLNVFKKTENNTLAVNSAKSIGCNLTNVGPNDLLAGTPHLTLGVIWQIIRIGLLSRVNLKAHPELYRLLEPGETIEDLLKLPAEQILLRWFNYHLKAAGHPRRVTNFAGDIKDSECYTVLLAQIAPKNLGINTSALSEKDTTKRAGLMLGSAEKMDARKFVREKDVVAGNAKLNLAFVANLFNMYPALEPVEEVVIIPDSETREEKTYRNFMNSLGVNPFVNNLYDDLRDGLVLLQLFDKIQPGVVQWNKVNQPPWKAMGANMKKLENCNYATQIAKEMGFSIVGISGNDINQGNKTLTLAVVWQMMRAYLLAILSRLSGDGTKISDAQIIQWINSTLSGASKGSSISGWKDESIKTSKPVLDLVDAIRSGAVDYSMIAGGRSEKELLDNARYAISAARKIGATVFSLPEDFVEGKDKMIMAAFAAIMAAAKGA